MHTNESKEENTRKIWRQNSMGNFFIKLLLFSIGRSNLNKFTQQTPKNRRIPAAAYNYRSREEAGLLKAPADASKRTHTSLWMLLLLLLRNMCSCNFVTKALNF